MLNDAPSKRLEFCRACRAERDEIVTAEFIIWGKLTPPEHLGPRCYDHTAAFVGATGMNQIDQWAIFDLRPHMAPEQRVAAKLDELADEMDERPWWTRVTADDIRAEAAKLRGEDQWCNCQAIFGTVNYPGPRHPKGDSIGCLKYGVSGASDSSAVAR